MTILNQHHRVAGLLLVLVALLALSGCQTRTRTDQPQAKTVNFVPSLMHQENVSAGYGLVVARIVHAGGQLPTLNYMTLTPKNYNADDDTQKLRLQSVSEDMDRSNIFAGKVKPGQYALSSMRAFYTFGYSFYSQFVPLDATFGTFEIKPGQVTDLGVLIYYPKPQEDKFVHTLLRQDAAVPGQLVEQHFPLYDFDKDNVLGWLDDGKDDVRYEQYLATVQNPVSFNERFKSADGTVYFLSGLGVILKRAVDGQWSMDAVNTNLKLNTIAESDSGAIAVGGDGGRIFVKPLQGQWQDISIDAMSDVDSLVFRAGGLLEAVSIKDKIANIYQTPTNEGGKHWRKIISYSTSQGWLSPEGKELQLAGLNKHKARYLRTIVSVTNDLKTNRITINTKRRMNNGMERENFVYVYEPDTWLITAKLVNIDVSTTFDAGAVTMGIRPAGFWSWGGQPDYVISDKNSGQWQQMSTSYLLPCPKNHDFKNGRCYPKKQKRGDYKATKMDFEFITAPMFLTQTQGVAIVKVKIKHTLRPGQEPPKRPPVLLLTDDGGKSWRMTDYKLPHEYCYNLEPLVSDRLLLSCDGASGDFYESTDLGKTWLHVRENQSF